MLMEHLEIKKYSGSYVLLNQQDKRSNHKFGNTFMSFRETSIQSKRTKLRAFSVSKQGTTLLAPYVQREVTPPA